MEAGDVYEVRNDAAASPPTFSPSPGSVVWVVPLFEPSIVALDRPAICSAMMKYVGLVLAVSPGRN